MADRIDIKFDDANDSGLKVFDALTSELEWNDFIAKIKESGEQVNLRKLLEDWLEGK